MAWSVFAKLKNVIVIEKLSCQLSINKLQTLWIFNMQHFKINIQTVCKWLMHKRTVKNWNLRQKRRQVMGRDTDSRTNFTSRWGTLTYDISKRSKLRRRSPRAISFSNRRFFNFFTFSRISQAKMSIIFFRCGIFQQNFKKFPAIIQILTISFLTIFYGKIQVLLKVIFLQF